MDEFDEVMTEFLNDQLSIKANRALSNSSESKFPEDIETRLEDKMPDRDLSIPMDIFDVIELFTEDEMAAIRLDPLLSKRFKQAYVVDSEKNHDGV